MSDVNAAEIVGLQKTYRTAEVQVDALQGLDLTIAIGSFTAIMGASGSGKSTLLHALAGLTDTDAGSIRIVGQDISQMDDDTLTRFRRDHLGIVFQAFNLVPVLSARENVALPLILGGTARAEALLQADAALAKVGLAPRAGHRPDALSGGEQQRVAIARALVAEPALILADEPTGNLDSVTATAICDLLAGLHQDEGRTLVIITHEPQVACRAERVVVLDDGAIVGDLSGEVVTNPTRLTQRYHSLVGADTRFGSGAAEALETA